MIERELAKCQDFDIGVEDHGILVMFGSFYYEGGSAQGMGYAIDASFLYRFFDVFNVEKLRDVNGKSCWVTHTHERVLKIEPLHKNEGKTFDLDEWRDYVKTLKLPSPYELRTGQKP